MTNTKSGLGYPVPNAADGGSEAHVSCILASIAIFLFLTLTPYLDRGALRGSLRNDGLFHEGNGDDSLSGAVKQEAGKSMPEPYQVADPQGQRPPVQQQQPQQQPQQQGGQGVVNPAQQQQQEQVPMPRPQWTFEVKDDVYFDPAGPRPDQVVLLMASDGKGHNGGIEHLFEMAMANRQEYADFHGYKFHFINISRYDLHGAHPVWAKIPALLDTFIHFPDVHWVWWLDVDAMIMNPDIDLNSHVLSHAAMRTKFAAGTEFLKSESKHTGQYMSGRADPKEIDVIIGQDHNGLNAGSFFLRRSKFTKMLLDWWEEPFYVYNQWPGKEQDALLHMVEHHRAVREHLALVPQRVLNGFPVGWENMGWHTDDLVVHLAGCWVDNACNERWQLYWNSRTSVVDLKAKGQERPTDRRGMVTKILPDATVYVPMPEQALDGGRGVVADAT
ncbi:hypothetical protein Dda_1849 [Drechslerella dactyloides]|uniref:Uncharacterized protein n=1 Tax=Drechslerella dactyloides TaxID=74499 RepID=A0AAD6NM53_DREDA|nr:hypothetical protein Dda_1849 [Drechslerella dactyloides]